MDQTGTQPCPVRLTRRSFCPLLYSYDRLSVSLSLSLSLSISLCLSFGLSLTSTISFPLSLSLSLSLSFSLFLSLSLSPSPSPYIYVYLYHTTSFPPIHIVQVASDCIWSDPASEVMERCLDETGFGDSPRGGGAVW